MSFFQNLFCEEFRGIWTLSDRKYSPTFVCKGNAGRGPEVVTTWNVAATYDLSGNDDDANDKSILTITFSLDNNNLFKDWKTLAIDVGGSTVAATTLAEIAVILNANTTFTTWFTAKVDADKLYIQQKIPSSRLKFFIRNIGAETVLGFNKRAGVAELPTYFWRHHVDDLPYVGATTTSYRYFYADAQNQLVYLDMDNVVDQNVVNNAVDINGNSLGFDDGYERADWQLLSGRSGLFMFSKIALDGDNITSIIEYPAGAVPGDLAKKTTYQYGSGTQPTEITEEPYTLALTDMVYPGGSPP